MPLYTVESTKWKTENCVAHNTEKEFLYNWIYFLMFSMYSFISCYSGSVQKGALNHFPVIFQRQYGESSFASFIYLFIYFLGGFQRQSLVKNKYICFSE